MELLPLACFYPAKKYRQAYLNKNPRGYCHIPLELLEEAHRPAAPSARAETRKAEGLSAPVQAVLYEAATEPPYSRPMWNRSEPGLYVNAATGEPLFSSRDKFYSPCGWPSFSRPISRQLSMSTRITAWAWSAPRYAPRRTA